MHRWALLASWAVSPVVAAPTQSIGYQGYAWTIDGVPIIPSVAVREGDPEERRTMKSARLAKHDSDYFENNPEDFIPNDATVPWDPTRITVPLEMGRTAIQNTANAGVTFTVTGHSFPFDQQPSGSAYWERRPVFVLRECAADARSLLDKADDPLTPWDPLTSAYVPRERANRPEGDTIFKNGAAGFDSSRVGSVACTCAETSTPTPLAGDVVVSGSQTPVADDFLALQVIPTSTTTGTISLSVGQVERVLTTAASGGTDGLIALTEGMESDWILCGQSETRKHTHAILSALDVLSDGGDNCPPAAQPCEVPPARGRFVAGVEQAADGLWNSATNGADPLRAMTDADSEAFRVSNGIILQFRRTCTSDLECIQRAEDGDPANDQDRENYINQWAGRYRRSCVAVPPGPTGQNRGSVCINQEKDKFCGQALYDSLNSKCCSSDTETGSGHVFPAELANGANGAPRTLERDPWVCPCTAGDGVDALAALEPSITHPASADGFDLGADVACGRDGEACCTYTKYSGLANAAPVAEVNPNTLGRIDFQFSDFLCPAFSDAQFVAPGGFDPAPFQRLGCTGPGQTYGITWSGANAPADISAIVPDYTILTSVLPDESGAGTTPVTQAALTGLYRGPDLYKYGSVSYPFYSCYNTQYRSCCDDGTVFNPATSQCCPITGIQPVENPCPCVDDGDCSAGKTCCSQTSPPPVREAYLNAQCSRYANHHGTGTDLQESYDATSGSNLGGLLTSTVPLTDRLYLKFLAVRGPGPAEGPMQADALVQALDTHYLHPADERVRSRLYVPAAAGVRVNLNDDDAGDSFAGFGPLSAMPARWPARQGGVCPGKCIDPSWQLCCNGAVCHESYESCCNTTCCNKKSQGCVSAGHLAADAHGVHTITSIAPYFSRAASWLKLDDVWSGIEQVEDRIRFHTNLGSSQDAEIKKQFLRNVMFLNLASFDTAGATQGRSQWFWTANNLNVQYDMCTEIEYLSPIKAFWVFVLPTILLVFTVVAAFVAATFVNAEANKNEGEGFRFYDKWVLGLATLQAAFVLPAYFSPQWVYALVVVLASLFGLVAFAARSRYLKTVFIVLHLVVLIYLINPFSGNAYLGLSAAGDPGLVPAVLGNWATYDRFNQLDRQTRFYDFGAWYGDEVAIKDGDDDGSYVGLDARRGGGDLPQVSIPDHFQTSWYALYHPTEPFLNQNLVNQDDDDAEGRPSPQSPSQCQEQNRYTPGRTGPWETPGDYCLHGLTETHDFYGGHTHLTRTLPTPESNVRGWNTYGSGTTGETTTEDQKPNAFSLGRPSTSQTELIFGSSCSRYYDYFELDVRLLDVDRQANHDERFFGYCSRGWTVFLAVCAGIVIMLGLLLLVIAILTLILASIEQSTPAKSSAFVHGPLPEVPAIYAQ